jgi:hypothetical protein
MKSSMLTVTIFIFVYANVFPQTDSEKAYNVLSKYINNESNGRYIGWEGNRNDSLWLDATEYVEKIRSFGKPFRIEHGEQDYYVLSYTIDSLQVFADHAFGFVTLSSVAHGYCLSPLPIHHSKISKEYLLLLKENKWFILSETEDRFISVTTFIKWAEDAIKNRTWSEGEEYKSNTQNNLNNFKNSFLLMKPSKR